MNNANKLLNNASEPLSGPDLVIFCSHVLPRIFWIYLPCKDPSLLWGSSLAYSLNKVLFCLHSVFIYPTFVSYFLFRPPISPYQMWRPVDWLKLRPLLSSVFCIYLARAFFLNFISPLSLYYIYGPLHTLPYLSCTMYLNYISNTERFQPSADLLLSPTGARGVHNSLGADLVSSRVSRKGKAWVLGLTDSTLKNAGPTDNPNSVPNSAETSSSRLRTCDKFWHTKLKFYSKTLSCHNPILEIRSLNRFYYKKG